MLEAGEADWAEISLDDWDRVPKKSAPTTRPISTPYIQFTNPVEYRRAKRGWPAEFPVDSSV